MTGRHRAPQPRPPVERPEAVTAEQLAAFHARLGERTQRRIQAVQPRRTER